MMDENFLDIRGVVCRRADGAQRSIRSGHRRANPDPKAYPQYPGGAILGWLVTNLIETMTEAEKRIVLQGGLGSRACATSTTSRSATSWHAAPRPEVCDLIGAFTCSTT